MNTRNLLINELAIQHGWNSVEIEHAQNTADDAEYQDECIVETVSGRNIHTPAHPAPCHYVRVVQAGFELAYWNYREWEEDPIVVMGALLGAAHRRK